MRIACSTIIPTIVTKICLASASPRRRELLAQLGVECLVLPANIDEDLRPSESPEAYVRRMAREKAGSVFADRARRHQLPVLAADTSVVVGGTVLGKPQSIEAARVMLAQLAGREHLVLSAVALQSDAKPPHPVRFAERLSTTTVRMRAMTSAEIEQYSRSSEPMDKAGGYAIQGRAAAFIESIHGSYSGVMGLPLFETAELLGTLL